jgi:hypothetical protein
VRAASRCLSKKACPLCSGGQVIATSLSNPVDRPKTCLNEYRPCFPTGNHDLSTGILCNVEMEILLEKASPGPGLSHNLNHHPSQSTWGCFTSTSVARSIASLTRDITDARIMWGITDLQVRMVKSITDARLRLIWGITDASLRQMKGIMDGKTNERHHDKANLRFRVQGHKWVWESQCVLLVLLNTQWHSSCSCQNCNGCRFCLLHCADEWCVAKILTLQSWKFSKWCLHRSKSPGQQKSTVESNKGLTLRGQAIRQIQEHKQICFCPYLRQWRTY